MQMNVGVSLVLYPMMEPSILTPTATTTQIKKEQIDTLHKLDERIEATGEEAEQEETTTTNGIF
jgi:hypothetical protein